MRRLLATFAAMSAIALVSSFRAESSEVDLIRQPRTWQPNTVEQPSVQPQPEPPSRTELIHRSRQWVRNTMARGFVQPQAEPLTRTERIHQSRRQVAEELARDNARRALLFQESQPRYGYLGDALVKINPPVSGTHVRMQRGSADSRAVTAREIRAERRRDSFHRPIRFPAENNYSGYKSRPVNRREIGAESRDFHSRPVNSNELNAGLRPSPNRRPVTYSEIRAASKPDPKSRPVTSREIQRHEQRQYDSRRVEPDN